MAGGETLWITLQNGTFHNKTLRESLYIYIAQLRHHQENTNSILSMDASTSSLA